MEKKLFFTESDWEIEKKKCRERKMEDLSFIKSIPISKMNKRKRRCFWSVKTTGDYQKDFYRGANYAILAEEYIVKNNRVRITPKNPRDELFVRIVFDMPRKEKATGIEAGFLWFFAKLAQRAGFGGLAEFKKDLTNERSNHERSASFI